MKAKGSRDYINRPLRRNRYDLGRQLNLSYGRHRSGWAFAVEALACLHDSRAVYLDTFIERTFIWGKNVIPPEKEWIGIIHVPPVVPPWFRQDTNNDAIFLLPAWQRSYQLCRGLFTLSEYHRQYLQPKLGVPLEVLLHPMEEPEIKWSFDAFLRNPARKIVQVGWWLRNMHAIFELPPGKLQKVFLQVKDNTVFRKMIKEERDYRIGLGLFEESMYDSAEIIHFLPDSEYDRLIAENIVFINLYDASANNTVVECIARNTPLLVNKIPSVVEYLGPDYPFYYSSYEEAVAKAENVDQVFATHQYLKGLTIKERMTPKYFRDQVSSSALLAGKPGESRFLSPVSRAAIRPDARQTVSSVCPLKKEKAIAGQPTFCLLTTCLNNAAVLERTIISILSQAGDFKVRYHVVDRNSSDETTELLKTWKERLDTGMLTPSCREVAFSWSSEYDCDYYEAVYRGFALMGGGAESVMSTLDPGSYLLPGVLALIDKLFKGHPKIQWLGSPSRVDAPSCEALPATEDLPVPTPLIEVGLCDGYHWPLLQRDGHFFKKPLWFRSCHALERPGGNWSLYREMARYSDYYQLTEPLYSIQGGETVMDHTYAVTCPVQRTRPSWIDEILPLNLRRESLQQLVGEQELYGNLIKVLDRQEGYFALLKDYQAVRKHLDYLKERSDDIS